jgi:hypothetical protein
MAESIIRGFIVTAELLTDLVDRKKKQACAVTSTSGHGLMDILSECTGGQDILYSAILETGH